MPEKLPPLEVQQRIVDKIEPERKVIASLREMVKTYEEKIKRVIDSVWGSETLCFSVTSVVKKINSPQRTKRDTEENI